MASTRRLAAILAADVAGYSRLMGADEEGTHERLRARRRELVDPKIGEHHGRIAFVSLPVARLDRLLHFFERNRSLTRAVERAAHTFDVVPAAAATSSIRPFSSNETLTLSPAVTPRWSSTARRSVTCPFAVTVSSSAIDKAARICLPAPRKAWITLRQAGIGLRRPLELVGDGGMVAAQRRQVVGHRMAGDALVVAAIEGRRQA
jgi:class 3 adenylate cyclase